MGIERIHPYILVRLLRVIVPLLVVVVASLFAWNYLERRAGDRPDEAETRLEENMAVLTEGMTLTQGEGGRESFRLSAGRNLGFDSGLNQLQGEVELTIRGEGETPDRLLRANECPLVQPEDVVECEGGIEIELDENTVALTERVSYDIQSGTVSTLAPVQVVREGEFELRADHMRVLLRERLVDLQGHVQVVREGGSRLEADAIRYDERSGFVTLSGGVRLFSEVMELSGEHATALLLPGSTVLSAIEVRENVRAESLDVNEPGRLRASELDVDVVSGRVESVRARGNVVVESGADSERRVLSGEEVAADFDPEGSLTSLESVGDARMMLDSGETIRSHRIRQTSARTIETVEDAVLELQSVRVEGSHFLIEETGSVRFSTDFRASIAIPAGVLTGDKTRASVDPDSGTLSNLDQTGSVRFALDGREGQAEEVHVDPMWVAFEGNVRIEDPEYTLEAEGVRFHRTDDALEADREVFLVTRLEGEPVTVTSDQLRGRGEEAMRFGGDVVLRRGGTEVRAERIDVDTDGRAFVAFGTVDSVMEGLRVRADTLRFDDAVGRVDYSGQVRARTEEISIDAEILQVTLLAQEIDRIDAGDGVEVSTADGMEGMGDAAVYLRSEDSITLSGPGAEVTDPASGRCRGDEIVVDISTHAVSVRSQNGRPTVCVPFGALEGSAGN